MTGAAQPSRVPEERGHGAAHLMTEALTDRATLRAELERLDTRIREAVARGADHFFFPWATADGREADVCVYYELKQAGLAVLAGEVKQIDSRRPTTRERLSYERQFMCDMDAAGETWEEVASYIWEKAN